MPGMKGIGRPVSVFLKSRGYAAQAAAQTSGGHSAEPQVTTLPSGLTVASIDQHQPVSRVGLYFTAGSRFETHSNAGTTHMLRNAANMSSELISVFKLASRIQQVGGNLTCTTSRDYMMYTVESARDGIDECVLCLVTAFMKPPHYLTWELNDTVAPLTAKHSAVLQHQPQGVLLDALHRAAYRGGMSNSLYSPECMLGRHTPDMLHQYVSEHYNLGSAVLVGSGVTHDSLLDHAQHLKWEPTRVTATEAAQHLGAEVRVQRVSPITHAAVVTPGAGLTSPDLVPLAILQQVMGGALHVKRGSNTASSKVNKAAAGVTGNPTMVSCLNLTSSDSGLFGFQVAAQSQDIAQVLRAVMRAFSEATKDGVTDVDVARAKTQLKAHVLMGSESGATVCEDLGTQVLALKQLPGDMVKAIDAVTPDQVRSVAKKVINAKPSMAVLGDTTETPHLDQLL